MKMLTMALCFLDEDDNVVAKENFNVTWKEKPEIESKVEKVIILDAVSGILINEVKSDIDRAVTELLHKTWKD